MGREMYVQAAFGRKSVLMRQNGANAQPLALVERAMAFRQWAGHHASGEIIMTQTRARQILQSLIQGMDQIGRAHV